MFEENQMDFALYALDLTRVKFDFLQSQRQRQCVSGGIFSDGVFGDLDDLFRLLQAESATRGCTKKLGKVDGRQAAIAFADGYFARRAIEVVPNVSVKIFKYSGKSLESKAFAVFFAPERLFTKENLLRDSDFSSEMWYNAGASGS